VLLILCIAGLLYGYIEWWYRQELEKPAPAPITEIQRKHAKQIEKRFSLAGWTWISEGKRVDLYDPAIKRWRKVQ
jgi:hypothetical protein